MIAVRRFALLVCTLALPLVARAAPAEGEPGCADTSALEARAYEHGWSANGLIELADAYACHGRAGRAILAYERARLLSPRVATITRGLATARTAAGLSVPSPPFYVATVWALSADTWSWLAAGALWTGVLMLLLLPPRHRLLRIGAVALFGASALFATSAWLAGATDEAIVIADHGAALHLSPFAAADVEANEPEGAHVTIVGHHDGYLRVRDGEGRTGWIDSRAIEPIIAATGSRRG
jgi:hypothetical protein